MMLETVAAVPGMSAGMLLHLKSLRLIEHSGGWIRALLEEAENERMHLMTFMEVSKPKWYERALIFSVQVRGGGLMLARNSTCGLTRHSSTM